MRESKKVAELVLDAPFVLLDGAVTSRPLVEGWLGSIWAWQCPGRQQTTPYPASVTRKFCLGWKTRPCLQRHLATAVGATFTPARLPPFRKGIYC